MIAPVAQAIVELLDARLVGDRSMAVGPARRRLRCVDPVLAMDMIEVLGLTVIGLKIVLTERPGRRDSAMVSDVGEVLLADPE